MGLPHTYRTSRGTTPHHLLLHLPLNFVPGIIHTAAWTTKQHTAGFSAPCLNGRTVALRTCQGRFAYVTITPVDDAGLSPLALTTSTNGEQVPGKFKHKESAAMAKADAPMRTFRFAAASHDRWLMEQRMSLTIRPNGSISKAFASKCFDYTDLDLLDKPLNAFLDTVSEEPSEEVFNFFLQMVQLEDRNFRSAWKLKSGKLHSTHRTKLPAVPIVNRLELVIFK